MNTQVTPTKLSRRNFLKWVAASIGAVMTVAFSQHENLKMPEGESELFTSWGQIDLTFADLEIPYRQLSDWYATYLPLIMHGTGG